LVRYRLKIDRETGLPVPDLDNPLPDFGNLAVTEKAAPPTKKPSPKKAKKEPVQKEAEKVELAEVDISGCRYSGNVLKQVMKDFGLKSKDKKAVIGAALSQDEDLNRYLNKGEIEAGAAIVAASKE